MSGTGIQTAMAFNANKPVPVLVCESLFTKLDLNKDDSLSQLEVEDLIEEHLGLDVERAEAALLLMDKGECSTAQEA